MDLVAHPLVPFHRREQENPRTRSSRRTTCSCVQELLQIYAIHRSYRDASRGVSDMHRRRARGDPRVSISCVKWTACARHAATLALFETSGGSDGAYQGYIVSFLCLRIPHIGDGESLMLCYTTAHIVVSKYFDYSCTMEQCF